MTLVAIVTGAMAGADLGARLPQARLNLPHQLGLIRSRASSSGAASANRAARSVCRSAGRIGPPHSSSAPPASNAMLWH